MTDKTPPGPARMTYEELKAGGVNGLIVVIDSFLRSPLLASMTQETGRPVLLERDGVRLTLEYVGDGKEGHD